MQQLHSLVFNRTTFGILREILMRYIQFTVTSSREKAWQIQPTKNTEQSVTLELCIKRTFFSLVTNMSLAMLGIYLSNT